MHSIHTANRSVQTLEQATPGNLKHTLAEAFQQLQNGTSGTIRSVGGTQLDAKLAAEARQLLVAAGISHGQRVIVRARHSVASVAWLIALWNLGATPIPVNGQINDSALAAIASDSQAVACCDPDAQSITPLAGKVGSRFRFRTPPQVTGVDLALIIYTSGSTGQPKGILLSHANVMAALNAIAHYQRLSSADSILCVPPLHFDYGLYQVLFGMHIGCSVWLVEPPVNPVRIINWIKTHRPNVFPVVPALGGGVAQTLSAFKQTLAGVRLITNTGGHLPEQTIKGLQQGFPDAEVMPMYGLTESKRALFLPTGTLEQKPGSVGRPMPGLDAKVFVEELNTDGQICYREAQPDEVGKLFVRGASVMQGYNNPAANGGATLIPGLYRDDNWLDTGDLFCCDDDGFFYFRGRDKELIKQGGYCLYPREIEAQIERHEAVLGAVVVGDTDRSGDEIACLFVRLQSNTPEQQGGFKQWLKLNIDADYLPRRVHYIEEWPLNANGKIDRNRLKQSVATP